MEMITHVNTPKPHNIKHPSKPWYVVSLEVLERSRKYFGVRQRFAIAVESPEKLAEARRALQARRAEFGITELGEIQTTAASRSFRPCDINLNWWEIECAQNYNGERTYECK